MSKRWAGGLIAAWALLCVGTAWAESIPKAPEGSHIGFVGENLIATADGTFHRWHFASVDVDLDALSAGHVEVEIAVASLDTGIDQRDDHLRSADFFEVSRWPTARVRVEDVTPSGDGQPHRAQFEITIRDVTQRVEGTFEFVEGEPLRVRGEVELDRRTFGVGPGYSRWNPMAVRPSIPIRFDVALPPGAEE